MARSLSLKVPTASVISMVEDKIAKIKADLANYPADVKQYELDYKAHQDNLVNQVINALSNNPELIGQEYGKPIRVSIGYRGVDVSIDANALGLPDAPKKPEDPNERKWFGREHSTPLEMLEKTLKVLRMTNQEEVNASTYSSVMDLL